MSMPSNESSSVASCTSTSSPRKRRVWPAERSDASRRSSSSGKSRSSSTFSRVSPTAPVAPSTARRVMPPPRGAFSSSNAACTARTASGICEREITHESLIGDVEIMRRLIWLSASVRNILAATPGCERMPAPMIEILPRRGVLLDLDRAERPLGERDRAAGRGDVLVRHRERQLGDAVHHVLDDRVDVDVLGRDGVEHLGRGARAIGDAGEGEDDFGLGVRDSRDDGLFHDVLRGQDPGAFLVRERRTGVHANPVVSGKLDRAQHQHLRPGR